MVAQRTDFFAIFFALRCTGHEICAPRKVCGVFEQSARNPHHAKAARNQSVSSETHKGAFSRALVGFEPTFPD